MLGIFSEIFEIVTNLPAYIAAGAETILNLFFELIETTLNAAVAVLPGLPETVSPPGYVTAINWFFPLTTVLGLATTMLTGYVVFLGVRWVFSKAGQL